MITLRALLFSVVTAWLMTSASASSAQAAAKTTSAAASRPAEAHYLLDPLGQLDAQQVAAMPAGSWRTLSDGQTPPQLGLRAARVWIKLPLPNTGKQTLWVSIANPSIEQFAAFAWSDTQITPLQATPILNAQGFPALPKLFLTSKLTSFLT